MAHEPEDPEADRVAAMLPWRTGRWPDSLPASSVRRLFDSSFEISAPELPDAHDEDVSVREL